MNQECQLLFLVFVKPPVVKNPSNYLPITMLFIHSRYELSYRIFYDQCALIPQSLSAKSIYFVLTAARNRKFSYGNHISYDWWKSVSKQTNFVFFTQTNSWEYIYERQPQSSLTFLSVKIAADQLCINWSSVSFHWIRVWATGKYKLTLWLTTSTRIHELFCKGTKSFVFSEQHVT